MYIEKNILSGVLRIEKTILLCVLDVEIIIFFGKMNGVESMHVCLKVQDVLARQQ